MLVYQHQAHEGMRDLDMSIIPGMRDPQQWIWIDISIYSEISYHISIDTRKWIFNEKWIWVNEITTSRRDRTLEMMVF